jgi:hypothetical protein
MKKIYCFIIIIIVITSACSSERHLHKIESDKKFKNTESINFAGEKALTQWWYFDCFFEDGSVMVFLFTPYEWWGEKEKANDNHSFFYFSYIGVNGEVISERKVFNIDEVKYDKNSIKCPYFEIVKSHSKLQRNYSINFFMEEVKGSAEIKSASKAFSPFPTGCMGPFLSKHLLKRKGEDLSYRYAAHVPQGHVVSRLIIKNDTLNLSGKAYHEQGWFHGAPDQIGNGWAWFHYVSKDMNVFGTPGRFFCLEKGGRRLMGGFNFRGKGCVLSDVVYAEDQINFLLGGKLNYVSSNLSFEINPTGKTGAPLICIPSNNTDQLWGTVLQPAVINFHHGGKDLQQSGLLLLETCMMSKIARK